MKWFKHYCDLRKSDSFIQFRNTQKSLIDAYGCFCLYIELCAEKVKPGDKFEFRFNKVHLQNEFGMKWKRLENVLRMISESFQNEIIIEKMEIIIKFPNILEIRDNHLKNLQVKSKLVAPKILDKDKDKDKKNIYSATGVTPHRVVELFNETLGMELAKVQVLSDKRKRATKALFKTLTDETSWTDYFNRVKEIDFLTGRNDRGWKADFDWLLNFNNYLKVIEGKYTTQEKKYDF